MQMKIIGVIAALLAAPAAAVAQTPAPSDAKLYFISPQNGETTISRSSPTRSA